MTQTTYAVRLWSTRTAQGPRGNTYKVRWATAGHAHAKTFATAKLADSFRSALVTASRAGAAFDIDSGLPLSMVRRQAGPTWLAHAQAFLDMKWPDASPRHRQSTAEGLTTITLAMVTDQAVAPDPALLRKVLRLWAFNTTARRARGGQPPPAYAEPLAWITTRSRPVADLEDPSVLRHVLSAISANLDGSPTSPSTTNRKRAALSGALSYAVELGQLPANPLPRLRVTRRAVAQAIDARVVVNPDQARALLAAVKTRAPALHAYFGCLYYAGLRPAEAANLRDRDLTLPASGWGQILLSGSYQPTRGEWTDDGARGEERALKHRARASTRVSLSFRHYSRHCGSTWPASVPEPTGGCSSPAPARSVGPWRSRSFGRSRPRAPRGCSGWRGSRRSPPSSRPRRWAVAPTTCGTRVCPPGWPPVSHPARSPPGPVTAWPSCCGSTRTPSTDKKTSPAAASPRPSAKLRHV